MIDIGVIKNSKIQPLEEANNTAARRSLFEKASPSATQPLP